MDQTTENQFLDLKKYCEARGWQIIAECSDEGISGAEAERPGLKQIMALARKRKFDTLLVWRFDRFARSLAHLVNSLDELRQIGVDFASYQEGVDTSTAQGRMVFGIMASLAEFEHNLIRDRIMAGLRRARAEGRRLGRQPIALDLAKVRRLKQEGRSVRQIAAEMGTGRTTVWKAIKALSAKPAANPGRGIDGTAR
jgi:DNA invertase Pin-like site-specific DNA recombinase